MNCSEARALLAIYEELQSDQEEVVALQTHLSNCAACQQRRMQYQRVGTQIRSLPPIEPSPDAHTKLMQALAVEHVHVIQRTHSSTVSTPTPAFLVPYMKDLDKHTNHLVAFSTADTGPLPSIPSLKRRSTHQIRQFAIIGLAASFLMILMISGLTSLLLLGSSQGHNIPTNPVIVNNPRDVQSASISTQATYPSIASATVNGNTIFYTSYSNQAASWDLEQLDKNTKESRSLLATPATDELFILGSSTKWLVWLQISVPPTTQNLTPTPQPQASATPTSDAQPTNAAQSGEQKSNTTNPDRQWGLFATYLGAPLTLPLDEHTITAITSQQTFHANSVPNWINKPVQGIWLNDSQLFAAIIDDKGNSHLFSYQLELGKAPQPTEIATTNNGHIFTSPTASSDNQNIYWGDEWLSDQGELKGNIWTLQPANTTSTGTTPTNTPVPTNTPISTPHLFQVDGMSFHPEMVANNLFFLSKNPLNNNTTTATATPTVTATPSPTPTIQSTATPQATATPTPIDPRAFRGGSMKVDPSVFTPQIDDAIQGRVHAFTASGTPEGLPQLDSNRIVSALQGGSRYLIWQNSGNAFEMYDVVDKHSVNVGSGTIPSDAAFVNINDTTGVWVQNSNTNNSNSNTVTFNIFVWPWPRKS